MKRIKLSLAYLTLRHVIYERVSSLFTIIAAVNEARNANAEGSRVRGTLRFNGFTGDDKLANASSSSLFVSQLSVALKSRRITRADFVGAVGREREGERERERERER